MAKRRKGAKRGTSASRSKSHKAKPKPPKKPVVGVKKRRPGKPVSPVQRKRAPKREKVSKKRARAARKGWETRRRENPLRWGREAIALRRQNSKVVESSTAAIEREWKRLEKKALRQAREAEKAGGIHPTIAAKLAALESVEAQIQKMKDNIRTFNSPSPDQWEIKAYNLLEKFITLRDFGASSEDLKKAHQKWYQAKMIAREKSKDWPAWMAMIGSVLGLPMHGTFSVDSFVTS